MYTYKIDVSSVYDGDTITGIVDLGFSIKAKIKVRLARIDTPEIRTRNLKEKELGYAARDFLRAFVELNKDSLYIKTTFKGKYGRWIGEIIQSPSNSLDSSDFININDLLVLEGHAVYRSY